MSNGDTFDSRLLELGRASRRAALLSLLGFLVIAGALVYATQELRALGRQRTDLQKERTSLEKEIARSKAELAILGSWKARLVQANEELSKTAKTAPPSVSMFPNFQIAENARYAVGIYGFGVSPGQYQQLHRRLEEEGYLISEGSLLEDRPSWLSPRSAVLYYHKASHDKAAGIADSLTRLTGVRFDVARGSGLGVIPGQERWSFFVHYVGR